VQPVAQGGIDANIGAKKMDKRKQIPVVRAVSPVFPPSVIPAPDSMKAVTGDVPKRAPMDIEKASGNMRLSIAERLQSLHPQRQQTWPCYPTLENLTKQTRPCSYLYKVAVQSSIST
jgi:hypothetical protein